MDAEVAGYRFQPQRQRPVLSDRPDVRGGEDPKGIEMKRNNQSRDGVAVQNVDAVQNVKG